MGRGPSGKRRRYWRELVARQRRSGLSVAAFCRRHKVSPASLYGWRQRLTEEATDEPKEVSFVPLPLQPAVPPRVSEFSVQLPNGVQVSVPQAFDAAALERLLHLAGTVEARDA